MRRICKYILESLLIATLIWFLIFLELRTIEIILASIILTLIIIIINFYLYYQQIMNTPLKQMKYRKPNFWIYYLFIFFLYPYFKFKNNVKYDKSALKGLKGPFLILSNHPSKPDFVYNASLIFPRRVNAVADRALFYNHKTRFLLTALGGIPKSLFINDIQTIKLILQAKKNNMNIMMMPEGRLSTTNENDKVTEPTAKLIKKLNIPVVAVKIQGAYFRGGKWVKNKRKGKILVSAKLLFKTNDLEVLSENEINKAIGDALANDDNKFLEENNIHYKGKDLIENLDSILYKCPNCLSEFQLVTKNNQLYCQNCHLDLTINTQFNFINNDKSFYQYKTIADWHKFQLKCIDELVRTDFKLEDEFKLRIPNIQKGIMEEVGKGVCLLTKEGFRYKGSIYGETKELFFSVSTLKAMAFICKTEIEIYQEDTYYAFEPINDPKTVVKWAIACEANHKINN